MGPASALHPAAPLSLWGQELAGAPLLWLAQVLVRAAPPPLPH